MPQRTLLFLVSVVAIGSSLSFAQFPTIKLDMTIHDVSGTPHIIRWGLDVDATSGIDAALGEIQVPPLPPAGFDARWVNRPGSSGFGQGLVLDLRQFANHVQADTYKVYFQPGPQGYPMTLAWSRTLVHDYYGCGVTLNSSSENIIDQHSVPQSVIDMRTNDSITIVDSTVHSLLLIASCPLGSNSISGTIFRDLNGNGIRENGEAGIAGWSVELTGPMIATSDAQGNFAFTNLPNGTYTVHNNPPGNGWVQTYPAGDYTITVQDGDEELNISFGVFEKVTAGGIKFNDMDGNGTKDISEPTIAGWKIYINGAANDSAVTDVNGAYLFTNLGPGTYSIKEKQDPAWVQMKPGAPGYYAFQSISGVAGANFDFGNKEANVFTGGANSSWSDPRNWSSGHPPGATDVVVVPLTVTFDVPDATVLAIRVSDGGALTIPDGTTVNVLGTFQVEEGSSLTFTTPPSLKAGKPFRVMSQAEVVCYGDWDVKGTFIPGTSKISFAGDYPKTILSSSFYDLDIAGKNTTTHGDITVQNQLILTSDFPLGTGDNLTVSNSATDAISDAGKVTGGTITRLIAPGETGPYRFTTPENIVQFDGNSNPDFVSMTSFNQAPPSSPNITWHVVPGTVNTSNHSVNGTGITHFSTWGVGTSGDGLNGVLVKNRGSGGTVNSTINSGGGGGSWTSSVQLGYDPDSLPAETQESTLRLLTGPYYTDTLPSSWRMVSLPVDAENPSKNALFPTSSSEAFAYNGSNYVPTATLVKGQGYWLRFDTSTIVSILGSVILDDTIPLVEGWNMIGANSYLIAQSSFMTVPPNIIQGPLFGYERSYQAATTLQPLHAYWLRASTAGSLILTSSGLSKSSAKRSSPVEHFNKITVLDASGNEQSLYFAGRAGDDARQFEAPPLPPAEAFDVRFGSNRYAEVPDKAFEKIVPLRINGASYPLTIRWSVKDNPAHASLEVGGKSIALGTSGSLQILEPKEGIQLKLSPASVVALPTEFKLEQNYPNPFNPTTMIEYSLPVPARVMITIYDVLGREVSTLVDEIQTAGFKQVAWTGNNTAGVLVAGGLYFYRLTAMGIENGNTTTVQVRKMLLLK